MSQLRHGLEKGKYAYSKHSLFISGDIVELFTGMWKDVEDGKLLVKCPDGVDLVGGIPMCAIKLRRPLTLDEYRENHHPDVRPLIKSPDPIVLAVILPTAMVCTIPDCFPEDE